MNLTLLVVLTVVSLLCWTRSAGPLAAAAMVTVIGAPLSIAIMLLPTVTAVLWIFCASKTLAGSYAAGAVALAAIIAALLGIGAVARTRAARHQASDTGIPELQPQGILAIPSRHGEINHSVLRPLVLGFDGVIMVPPDRAKNRSPQLVRLKTENGALLDPLRARLDENSRRSSDLLLNFRAKEVLNCVSVQDATIEEADVIERVDLQDVPGVLWSEPTRLTRLTYHRRDGAGFVECARATWVRYQGLALPLLTRITGHGVNVKLTPGLNFQNVLLAPDGVTAQDGGYVLTDVNPSFAR